MTTTTTFQHHYANLRAIAEQMRSQQEPDLDELVPLVDSALESYHACRERLDTVKQMLDERFDPAHEARN